MFWIVAAVFPTRDVWISWKSTFLDYLDLLKLLNSILVLGDSAKLELLRNYLGAKGQPRFDIHSVRQKTTSDEAFQMIDNVWVPSQTFIQDLIFRRLPKKLEIR
ncbi:hypothetical protein FGIG_03495 [Fasciola gigantica]|uniref:Uncharacterized protein n=1 Tax=Fasciola gigantica TaxID=46835 RepID=A0A504YPZ0_FASGI|nr:hypothetical protein FGIG_03495 [Fasciola gigantica]